MTPRCLCGHGQSNHTRAEGQCWSAACGCSAYRRPPASMPSLAEQAQIDRFGIFEEDQFVSHPYDKGGILSYGPITAVNPDTGGYEIVVPQCRAYADDENPDCVIGAVRCVLTTDHEGDHIWAARP